MADPLVWVKVPHQVDIGKYIAQRYGWEANISWGEAKCYICLETTPTCNTFHTAWFLDLLVHFLWVGLYKIVHTEDWELWKSSECAMIFKLSFISKCCRCIFYPKYDVLGKIKKLFLSTFNFPCSVFFFKDIFLIAQKHTYVCMYVCMRS